MPCNAANDSYDGIVVGGFTQIPPGRFPEE